MHARGFDPVIEDGMPADGIPTNGSDILLERDGERALLSSKYGTASLVGASALLGLALAADTARLLGGQLRLSRSADLGGLRAEIAFPR